MSLVELPAPRTERLWMPPGFARSRKRKRIWTPEPYLATTITQVGSATFSASVATTPAVVTTPTGAAAGDLLLFFIGWYDQLGATITPPAGSTLVPGTRIDHPSGGDDAISTAVYQLTPTGAPAGSYSCSVTPSTSLGMACLCYSVVSGSPVIDTGAGAPTINSGFSAAPKALGLTTSQANECVVLFFIGDDSAITSGFPTVSVLLDGASVGPHVFGAGAAQWQLCSLNPASQGATGDFTAATAGNDDWAVTLLAVAAPASGGIGVPYWAA